MAKGIILNLDALFAVLIASMFITTIALVQMPTPANVNLERTANDLSAVLDKSYILDTLNTTAISGNISALLPSNMDSDVNISCYTYNTTSGSFVSSQNITVSNVKNSTKTQPIITSIRYFPVLGVTNVSNYCLSRLEVWDI